MDLTLPKYYESIIEKLEGRIKKLNVKNRQLKLMNTALFKCYCGDFDSLTEKEKKTLPDC